VALTTAVHFVAEFIDDEDDVLLVFAQELGSMVDLVGGPAHAQCLLIPLELLAGVEESAVRDKVTPRSYAVHLP